MLMERLERLEQEQELQLRKPLGMWLLVPVDRGDWIDGIAAAALPNRSFQRRGDLDQVRKQMQELGADPDASEALDDAELAWLRC